ncbi:unnamed protein product [Callosobruchus maculatus]|uniref:Uncharacterized protein n=1 Tax=Callosobruchus maculatus TaxID=64391 RepID=A0A653C3M7_CALMS|nr:unnamed protein product [Callosobruchus maculatus]
MSASDDFGFELQICGSQIVFVVRQFECKTRANSCVNSTNSSSLVAINFKLPFSITTSDTLVYTLSKNE